MTATKVDQTRPSQVPSGNTDSPQATKHGTPSRFTAHSVDSAPEASRATLGSIEKAYGFVPNLLGTLANAPAALEAYMGLGKIFESSGFSLRERQFIFLAASVENLCEYCTAAHSTFLKGQLRVGAAEVARVRSGETLDDPKLDALVALTREVVRERGRVADETLQQFLDAGYAKSQLLEILVGVAMKTISNYADHLSPVDIDAQFSAER